MEDFIEFQKKFLINEYLIYGSEFWSWSVRPIQSTIGSSILSLNRSAKSMSELTVDEGRDLTFIIKVLEKTLREAFDGRIINYIMLMMVDHQVHFHVIPRYEREVAFNGISYVDEWWPKPPVIDGEPMEHAMLMEIRNHLKLAAEEVVKNA